MIRLKTKILNLIAIIMFTIMLFWTQTVFGTSDYIKLKVSFWTISIVVILFTFIVKLGIITLSKKEIYKFILIIGPYIMLLLYSIILSIIKNRISVKRTISENFVVIIAGITAFILYKLFKKNIVNIIFYAAVCNYSVYVVVYVLRYGIYGFTHFIQISEAAEIYGKLLEVHEVTFIFGILFVYFFINYDKSNLIKLIISAIYMFLGYKRILFGAILISIVLYCFFKQKKIRNNVKIWGYLLFGLCIFWLWFVNSNYYELIAMKLGIALNSRTFSGNGLYGRLSEYYTLSPFYTGYGVGFVHNIMIKYATLHNSGTTGFHNDILKYYIDLGFIVWFLFFGNMCIFITNNIKKTVSLKSAIHYLTLLTVTIICWTTDNLASYPNYLFVTFVLYFCVIFDNNRRNE